MRQIFILIQSKGSLFLSILPAFLGAFFAFLFFIVQERWRSRREAKKAWRKTVLVEHAYLERYLQYLTIIADENVVFQKTIEDQYHGKHLALRNLNVYPIREDASMNLEDLIFLNKIENLVIDLKRLNRDIETFNQMKNKMNEVIEKYILDQKRTDIAPMLENNLSLFLKESKIIINFQRMLKEQVGDLVAENSFLSKYYRKFFLVRFFLKKELVSSQEYRESEIKKCKVLMKESIAKIKEERALMYRKHGLVSSEDENALL